MPLQMSFVVPVHNGASILPEFLERLATVGASFECEYIFIDNGSSDNSRSIAEAFPRSRVLFFDKIKSPYPCRNLGIRASKSPYVALFDVKCVPDKKWLHLALETLAEPNTDIAVGPRRYIRTDPNDPFQICSTLMFVPIEKDISNGGFPAGALLARRSVFERFGFFPENIRSNGDTLWSQMVISKGAGVRYNHNMIVSYYAKTREDLLRQGLRIGFGNRQLYKDRGDNVTKIFFRSIYNMKPDSLKVLKSKCETCGIDCSTAVLGRVWMAMWQYKIYRGFGRLGLRRVLGLSAD